MSLPLSCNPCSVAARLRLRRVPVLGAAGARAGPSPALALALTNTNNCAFHPSAPVAHCRHLRRLHHHRQRKQPLAVPSNTTFPLRPRSPSRPTPSAICITQSPLATMASATSFYDFKPVDSKLCRRTPSLPPFPGPICPLSTHKRNAACCAHGIYAGICMDNCRLAFLI